MKDNQGKGDLSREIRDFMKGVDLSKRVCEASELVEGPDAVRYNKACDYPNTSDYVLVTEALKVRPGIRDKDILEIGSGPGNLCDELYKAGARKVVGADPSEEMLRHSRHRFQQENGNVKFVPVSVYDIPEDYEEAFDLVVCQNTVHQFKDPERALWGMVYAAKEDGQIQIFDFRRDVSKKDLAKRIRYTKPEIWQDFANSLCASLTKKEFKDILNQIGGLNLKVSDRQIVDINFKVSDAVDLSQTSERAEYFRKIDPVPHWMDYLVSQRVEIYKQPFYMGPFGFQRTRI